MNPTEPVTSPTPAPGADSTSKAPSPSTGGFTVSNFATSIRNKYPGGVTTDGKSYTSLSDQQLVDRIVQKFPVYKDKISDYKPVTTGSAGESVRVGGTSLADVGRDFSSFGHSIIGHEINAGQDIAAALGGNAAGNAALKLTDADTKYVTTLFQMRNEARAAGKDTSHWDNLIQNYKPQDHSQTLGDMFPTFNKSTEQVIGDFAGVGTDIASAGALEGAGNALATPVKGVVAGVKSGALAGAKTGAIVGGGQGLSNALSDNKDSSEVIGATAQGAATGAVTGAALGGVTGGLANAGESGPVVQAPSTNPETGGGMLSKAKNLVTETTRNIGKNISNYAQDTQQAVEARNAIRAKGPAAISVLDETGSPEFVNNIDKSKSLAELQTKAKMLDVATQHPALGGNGSRTTLPRQVIADEYVTPRVTLLQSRLGQLGKTIGSAKEDMTQVDTTDLVDSMVKEAQKQGVIVKIRKSGFNFSKAPGISGIDNARISTIKNMFEGFKPSKNGTFSNTKAQLAASRKNLSDLTSRADSAREVVSAGGAVDNTRRAIAQKIGGEYYQATKDYHDLASVLGKLDPDLGVTLSEDGAKNVAKIKMGDYVRRLLSNNAAQAKGVFTSLDELAQKEAARTGKSLPKQDLEDLVDTAGAIEEGLGITPRNSFFGQVSGAQKNALGGVPTSVGDAMGKVTDILTKSEANPKRAVKAMQAYTKDAIERQKKL